MRWIAHADADEFLATAYPFLRADPVLNQMPLGFANGARVDPSRYPGIRFHSVVADHGACIGATARTEGWNPVLSEMPVHVAAFVGARYAEESPGITGVFGPEIVAAAFAGAAFGPMGLTGVAVEHAMAVFELRSLRPVPAAAGARRVATRGDAEVLQRFVEAFHAEATPHDPAVTPTAGERYATSGKAHVWVDDGEIVAFANFSRDVEGFLSVGPVYTPSARRGHGYATSLVSEMGALALAEGRPGCTLFADLTNPTSNAIYMRIGYVRVGTMIRYGFR